MKPSSGLGPGVAVLVLNGMSKGKVGTIVAAWPDYAPGIPAWRLDLPDCRDRVIREDFLERVPS